MYDPSKRKGKPMTSTRNNIVIEKRKKEKKGR